MSKLITNWTYLLFSDISQAVINFFVFLLLAKKLSPAGYGEFNVVLAIVSLFSVFAVNLGANHVITREVTLRPETTKNLFSILIPVRAISFLLTSVAVVVYTLIAKTSDTHSIVFIIVLILANSLWDLSESIAFGRFVTKFTTIFNLTFSSLWLIVVFSLNGNSLNLMTVLTIYAGIYIIRALSYFVTVFKKFISTGLKEKGPGLKAILLMSLPYLWMRAFSGFSDQVPVLLLDKHSGSAEVGYFSVGLRLVIPITLAINTGLRAVFPFLTKLYFEDKEEFNNKLVKGFSFVLIWGTLAATALVTTCGFWIPGVLGDAYVKSIPAFNILAWFGVGLCFDLILSTVLSSTYKQNSLAIITAIDFAVMFPLLFIGSRYGATGLANARLAGMLIVIIYHIAVVVKLLKIRIFNLSFLFSFLFFIGLMLINILIPSFLIKIILIATILIASVLFKKSPVRQNIDYVIGSLKAFKRVR